MDHFNHAIVSEYCDKNRCGRCEHFMEDHDINDRRYGAVTVGMCELHDSAERIHEKLADGYGDASWRWELHVPCPDYKVPKRG